MEYRTYKYIYPPRPSKVIPQEGISALDSGDYFAQPKLNGTCAEVYVNGNEFRLMNRHAGTISTTIEKELKALGGRNGWNVFVGEYLNKSQKGMDGKVFNHKFVIFDVLVLDGKHLVGTTFEERQKMIYSRLSPKAYDGFLSQVSTNVFTVNNFNKGFKALYGEVIKAEMYEGLVFKMKHGKLENGVNRAGNTSRFQVKCRKPTKNYEY